ncbi:unnamed protein product [Camellia sinensis]
MKIPRPNYWEVHATLGSAIVGGGPQQSYPKRQFEQRQRRTSIIQKDSQDDVLWAHHHPLGPHTCINTPRNSHHFPHCSHTIIREKFAREMGVNPGEAVIRAKAKKKPMVANPNGGPVRAGYKPRFKPKCSGSLIPPKRRLVKEMMFESIVQAIASCFYPTPKHSFNNTNKN